MNDIATRSVEELRVRLRKVRSLQGPARDRREELVGCKGLGMAIDRCAHLAQTAQDLEIELYRRENAESSRMLDAMSEPQI